MPPGIEAWQNVTDNPALSRFELRVDGLIAFLAYERAPGSIRMLHTEVPEAFRGRGVGAALVKGALESARASGFRVVAVCPFVRAYLLKHPGEQSTAD
jgi:predicted GNAT family acetyltransferase